MEATDTINPIHRINVKQFHRMIEVGDSSLSFDLGGKLQKYARTGIERYWVVDVENRTIHDHRNPDHSRSRYRQINSVGDGFLSVTIEGVDIELDIGDLFRY